MIGFGTPAPMFYGRTRARADFAFHSVAGRYIVLAFLGQGELPAARAALEAVAARASVFDDHKASFFGVTLDPRDAGDPAFADVIPGRRFFFDTDGAISDRYGLLDRQADGQVRFRPAVFLLDPALRVMERVTLTEIGPLLDRLAALPEVDDHAGVALTAPVLIVPRVFEPAFCQALIGDYLAHGGTESGTMVEVDGMTVGRLDPGFKRRQDHTVSDPKLLAAARARVHDRLVPEIRRAFSFAATRMERYIVARYPADTGGFFRPHRDNTTKGTAHRRFAVSINLNAEAFSGGDLRFPEFGSRTYRPPTGGAVVFSCSLLHEATPVTAGVRYAFLPFLYDDAAARIRADNQRFLAGSDSDRMEETVSADPPA
ncbi:2OG-Fe(II) oxygenase [Segnochrobactraceae bacterium EtOH-i3]